MLATCMPREGICHVTGPHHVFRDWSRNDPQVVGDLPAADEWLCVKCYRLLDTGTASHGVVQAVAWTGWTAPLS